MAGRIDPLTPVETAALTGLYDDNPRLREAYLNKHGLEGNPKDPNQYRPLGDQGDYFDVDPGFVKQIRKSGWNGFTQELTDKIRNNAIPIAGYSAIGAAATGGAIEGLVGGPLAPATSAAAGVAQGAAMSAAIRYAKHTLAEKLAEKEVPADMEHEAYGAFVDGAMPGIMSETIGPAISKVGNKLKQMIQGQSEKALDGIRAAIGRGATRPALDNVAKNPALMDGVKIADSQIAAEHRKLFGINLKGVSEDAGAPLEADAADPASAQLIKQQNTPPEKIPASSTYGQKLKPQLDARDKEIMNLSNNPDANVKASEFLDPMMKMRESLVKQQKANKALTPIEQDALGLLDKQIGEFRTAFKIQPSAPKMMTLDGEKVPMESASSEMPDPDLNFAQAHSWLKRFQGQVFEKNDLGTAYKNPGAEIVAKTLGGGDADAGEAGVRAFLDQRATDAGSNLPQINANISNLNTSYNAMKRVLAPRNMSTKFLPGSSDYLQLVKPQTDAMGNAIGPSQVGMMDQLLGTNYEQHLGDLATQDWIRKITEQHVNQGSSNVMGALAGAGQSTLAGEAAESVGLGSAVNAAGKVSAAVKAGRTAKLRDPQEAIAEYIKQYGKNEAPDSPMMAALSHIAEKAAPVADAAARAAVSDPATSAVVSGGHALGDFATYQGEQQNSTPATPKNPFAQPGQSSSSARPPATTNPFAQP